MISKFSRRIKNGVHKLHSIKGLCSTKKTLNAAMILGFEYGHIVSVDTGMAVDKNNNPIPWYTYPTIEYLLQFDYSDKSIFEYGSGNSSLFWGKLAKNIISVENDENWYNRNLSLIGQHNTIVLRTDKESYIGEINKSLEKYDVIIIDGRWRLACAENAVNKLNRGGIIIVDNSDWNPKTTEFLNRHNFIQIDFSGFGPINDYTWTTSLFLTRDFNFNTTNKRQPLIPIGGLDLLEE